MKKIFCLLIFVLIFVFLVSCDNNGCKIYEHSNYYELKDVTYGKNQRQTFDLNLPKNSTTGLILFIHGGYWVSGDKSSYANEMVDWCTLKGVATCAINYRYTSIRTNYLDILDDIYECLRKVRLLSKDYNLNLTNLMLTGHSAGAHLSLLYAYKVNMSSPINPTCVVALSGPTDLTDENYYNDSKFNIKITYLFSYLTNSLITVNNHSKKTKELLTASPINYINHNSVPTIICHGTLDDVVPYSNAERLHDCLNKNSIYNVLIPYQNSGHNLENDQEAEEYKNLLMNEFVNRYL